MMHAMHSWANPLPAPTVDAVSERLQAFLRLVVDTARQNAKRRGAVVVYEAEGQSGIAFMPRSALDTMPSMVQWFVDDYDQRSEFVIIMSNTGEILRMEYE